MRAQLVLRGVLFLILAACRDESATLTAPSLPAVGPAKRNAASGLPAPGECRMVLSKYTSDTETNGLVARTTTGCSFPDSALMQVSVSGRIIASPNPNSTCCFPNTSYAAAGTYGPMGGGSFPANWQQLMVKVFAYFGNNTSTQLTALNGLAPGDPSATVSYLDGTFTGRQGATIYVERSAIVGSSSCTSPPATPPVATCTIPGGGKSTFYSALSYVLRGEGFAGEQSITVRRTKRTLNLAVAPDTSISGDSVTFTASSTDGRSVSARQWIFQDTTGATFTPACSGTSPICKYVPSMSGVMFVRARVGSNAFIEQAQVEANLLPVGLKAVLDRRFVGAGDSVRVTLTSVPAGKSIVSAAITGGSASVSSATCSIAICRATVNGSGTIELSATVNGYPRRAEVHVDTVPCPTGDSTMDNPVMRDMLRNLERIGNGFSPPKEVAGYLVRDSLGVDRWVIDSSPATVGANTCNKSGFDISLIPSGQYVVSGAHYHPGVPNSPATCEPGKFYSRGPLRGLPSPADWHVSDQTFVPVLILDPSAIARYGATTLSDSILDKRISPPTWFHVPTKSEFQKSYIETTRTPSGCTRP